MEEKLGELIKNILEKEENPNWKPVVILMSDYVCQLSRRVSKLESEVEMLDSARKNNLNRGASVGPSLG